MKVIFESKAGIFGEYGWKRISFWRYLMIFPEYVTRIRWERRKNEQRKHRTTE